MKKLYIKTQFLFFLLGISLSASAQSYCLELNPPFGLVPENIVANSDDGNGPCNVMDGNFYSRWSSNGIGEWISFDLGAAMNVGGVEIAFFSGNNRASIFSLEVSIDGKNWSTVLESQSSSGASTNLEEFKFSTQNIRYLRYVGQGNSQENNNWNSITEFRINEPRIPEIECLDLSPSSGLVPNRIVAVSDDGNGLCNLMDNDLTSYWSSNVLGESITFELTGFKDVDQVEIAFLYGETRVSVFDILVSVDGVNWTTVLKDRSSSGTSLDLEKFNFPFQSTKYLRYTVQGNSQDNNALNGITEFRIDESVLPESNCLEINPPFGLVPENIVANSDDGNGPCNVMDGNFYSRWSSNGLGEWISFDFGEPKNVGGVEIAFFSGNNRASIFDLEVSIDGENWSTVLENQSSSGASTNLEEIQFSTQNIRYLRYVGQGNSQENNNWNSITEFRINEPRIPEIECFDSSPSSGLVPNRIVAVSDEGNGPCNVMDNDLVSYWSSNFSSKSITFEMDGSSDVDQVEIAFLSGDISASVFDISVSDDGANWTTVLKDGSSSGASLALEKFNFPVRNTKYLRYTAQDSQDNNDLEGVTEFRINKFVLPERDCLDSSPSTGIALVRISVSSDDGNGPCNVMDGNYYSRWSSNGLGEWMTFDLGETKNVSDVEIAFFSGNRRTSLFDLAVSDDGSNWTNVLEGQRSSGNSISLEAYSFPLQSVRYLRYIGQGNSQENNNWNSISEFRINEAEMNEFRPFVTTWKTDNPGISGDNQITIPTFPEENYNYSVNWGDGSTNVNVGGNITHTYETPGIYEVSISGDFPRIYFNAGFEQTENVDELKIISVNQWGNVKWTSMESAFTDCRNLDVVASDIPNLTKVYSLASMFEGCDALVGNSSFDNWDVGNVVDMFRTFTTAKSFNQNLNKWDVSQVENMQYMFFGTTLFNAPIGAWDVGSVTKMSHMFNDSYKFNQDISEWDVSNVTKMNNMFKSAYEFNQNIGSWDVGNVQNMSEMFQYASKFNQDIGKWDVSQVEIMFSMFHSSKAFNQDIGDWDISGLTGSFGLQNMFNGQTEMSFENYDKLLLGWSTLSADERRIPRDVYFSANNLTFCLGKEVRQILVNDYGWHIKDSGQMADCIDSSSFVTTWKTNNNGVSRYNEVRIPASGMDYNYNVDWGDDTSNSGVTGEITHKYRTGGVFQISITGIFPKMNWSTFGDNEKLISIDHWGDIKWSSMEYAFANCKDLKIVATDTPDLSNVISLSHMFSGVDNIGTNLSTWDFSNISNMDYMFSYSDFFDSDISSWNISNVTTMNNMFQGASLSNKNYDALLNGWSSQTLKNGVIFNAGNSQYCQGQEARQKLINDFGWSITDAGKSNCNDPIIRPFITTWKTDNVGASADNQIKIPIYAPEIYNYSVDWGDGTSDIGITGSKTHTYEVPGVYQISISGAFPRIFMEESYKSDSYKLISVDQWGDQIWTGMSQAFQDCKNLHILASDIPDLRDVTSFRRMFVNATSMNEDISGWDTNDVLDMSYMFLNADSFNQDISSWDTSNVNSMSHMFLDANSFNQDLSSFNISNTKDLSKMFSGSGLSSLNYDKTLIGWAQQEELTQYITLDATNITYCASEDARQQLIDIYDWTINDGGISCDDSDMSLTSINAKGSIINTTTLTPNPVIAETILSFEKPVQLTEINIFDVSGRLVHSYSGSAVSDDGAYLLNVEELPSGTYFIRSLDAQGEQYQKQMVINK
ncbi:BspA family leucine-rich repeat surface protein [Zobellia barbeyronii]|uniref:BspA family leucine-rich repeat surface protein n=1 Tax=Zobellia barbeyronii TaxID=2748009 RepID=A0ABS5WE15_9FLAO|nr:BspA family leucine-rich repeat surface protein [Zobellia barbeyronii]MBT2161646.1 BspA family leucine-rich repeat surface protein [Zobellia barbeyronii]